MSPTHRKREVKKDILGKIKCEKKSRDRKISTYSYVESKVRTPLLAANMTERDRASRPAQQAGLPPSSHAPPRLLTSHRRSAFVFVIAPIRPVRRGAKRRERCPCCCALRMHRNGDGDGSRVRRLCRLVSRFARAAARDGDVHRHWLTRVHTRKQANWLSSFCRQKL